MAWFCLINWKVWSEMFQVGDLLLGKLKLMSPVFLRLYLQDRCHLTILSESCLFKLLQRKWTKPYNLKTKWFQQTKASKATEGENELLIRLL